MTRVNESKVRALQVVREQLEAAAEAKKCFACGCLRETVEALAKTDEGRGELAPVIERARSVLRPTEYDCLGCPVCFPALAANAFGEAVPGEGEGLAICPTDAPVERRGWPPLPGDYHVVRYGAPVAVCTLESDSLAADLARQAPPGLAIVGTLHTENLGIERIIRNVLANPNIRFLVVCGPDTEQAVGHLPGQSLASLLESGVDERGRIIGARGKRPVLKNVSRDQVEAFRRQVRLVDAIGADSVPVILEHVAGCVAEDPGPSTEAPVDTGIESVEAREPRRLVQDPAGYFVVYPDAPRSLLVLEHYTNAGVLDGVLEGRTPAALYATAIERALLSRLDHAAYLGRELARAEQSLRTGETFVQDRAAGEIEAEEIAEASSCGCGGACRSEGTT